MQLLTDPGNILREAMRVRGTASLFIIVLSAYKLLKWTIHFSQTNNMES